jgi:hypothetical protein
MKQPNLAVPINMASSDTRQEKPEEFCMTKADCCLSLSGVLTVSHAEDGSPNTEHILLSCLLCPDLPFPETRFSATSPKPACVSFSWKWHLVWLQMPVRMYQVPVSAMQGECNAWQKEINLITQSRSQNQKSGDRFPVVHKPNAVSF